MKKKSTLIPRHFRTASNSSRRTVGGRNMLLLLVLLVIFLFENCSSIEAKWTPNEQDDGGGPLPLSQAQREQLLQLEQAIMNSPDPQGTLMQVAKANNMDPQELVNMLERNHRDMGGGVPSRRVVKSWPQAIIKALSSLGLILSQMAQRNPRSFTLATISVLLMIHVLVSAPRTGLVMSKGSNLMSRGYTTMFNPPTKYVNNFMESQKFSQYNLSLPKTCKSVPFEELPERLSKDGVEIHKTTKKSTLVQAVMAQHTLDATDFMSIGKDDVDENETAKEMQAIVDKLYDNAAEVLSSRRLTEFVEPTNLLRIQSSEGKRQRSAVLVMKGMGNWGRYGLQPLRISRQQEGGRVASLTYTTLKGGHFDGQMLINVEATKDDTLVIQVKIGIPKKGRKLNKKEATKLAETIAQSISKSISTQTRQTLARKFQGKRYHSNFETRAKEKQHIRFENERKQEEMARDRRRKWQRQNPDAGRYRPSGDRMRSPNNC